MDVKCNWDEAYIKGILPTEVFFGFLSVDKYKTETVKQNEAKKKSEGTFTFMVMQ